MQRKFLIMLFVCMLFITVFFSNFTQAKKSENNFYVATNGNDSNPGTIDKPWATINHAATVLEAGKTVYIRGGTYLLNQQIRLKNSGNKTAWILYASYPGEQVIIDASNVKVRLAKGTAPYQQDQGAFQVEGVSYIRIKDLKITNSHNAGFTVRDSHHIELYNNTTEKTFSSGIAIWDTNHDGQGSHHYKVIGNTIINANTHEMLIPGYPLKQETPHEAISLGGAEYFEVAYNHVYDCRKEGIDVKETSKHGTVHHNYIHNLDRQGLYVDSWFGLLEDVDIYNNIVHDSSAGFALATEGGKLAKNINFHHNLIYNNRGTGILFARWGRDGKRQDIRIYNNTIYHNGYGKPNPGESYHWITGGLYLFSKNIQNINISNNIFSNNKGFEIGYSDYYLKSNKNINTVLKKQNITIQYNLINNKNNVTYPIYVGWPPDSYANIYPLKGTNFIEGKPLFVNAEQGNFYLQNNSSAIDKGNPEKNYNDPDGTRNDIGAFSYVEKQSFWWKKDFPPKFEFN